MGVPAQLAPFWSDEGNFTCFDTGSPGPGGEFPVAFWTTTPAVRSGRRWTLWSGSASRTGGGKIAEQSRARANWKWFVDQRERLPPG